MNAGADAPIKMKELEARTGVGREAIRFYIREGMIPEPERPKRNVALYNDGHVKRLLAIRHLRDAQELSLARIKSVLHSADFKNLAQTESLQGLERLLPALVYGVAPSPDRCFPQILADEGLGVDELEELCALNIVDPILKDGERWFDFRDIAIIRKWAHIRAAGFSRSRGYGPATLTRYKKIMDQLAELEVDEFLEAFDGDVNAESAAESAAVGIENSNDILSQMRTKALLRKLNERLNP